MAADGGRTSDRLGVVLPCEDLLLMTIGRDTSWKAMLGKDERDATEEEIAALEAEHGPFLPADGEGVDQEQQDAKERKKALQRAGQGGQKASRRGR